MLIPSTFHSIAAFTAMLQPALDVWHEVAIFPSHHHQNMVSNDGLNMNIEHDVAHVQKPLCDIYFIQNYMAIKFQKPFGIPFP